MMPSDVQHNNLHQDAGRFRPELLRGNPKLVRSSDGGPIRRILTGRHVKPVGYYPSFKAGMSLPVEADHEEGLLDHCEADPAVVRTITQPHRLVIPVAWQKRPLVYFPDIRRDLADGSVEIFETKRKGDRRLKDPFYQFKLKAAETVYKRLGWRFRLLTRDEIMFGPLYENSHEIAKWAFAKVRAANQFVLLEAVSSAGGRLPLGRAAEIAGGLECLYAFFVRRLVTCDLKRKLHPDQAVTCVDHETFRRFSPPLL